MVQYDAHVGGTELNSTEVPYEGGESLFDFATLPNGDGITAMGYRVGLREVWVFADPIIMEWNGMVMVPICT